MQPGDNIYFKYMLEERPQWLDHFDSFYKDRRTSAARQLFDDMKRCLDGKLPTRAHITLLGASTEQLLPLAADKRFLPMMHNLVNINRFVQDVLVYQLHNDVDDPQNNIATIAEHYYPTLQQSQQEEIKAMIALYDFFKQGRTDETVLGYRNIYAYILNGARALYAADYATAFTSTPGGTPPSSSRPPTAPTASDSARASPYITSSHSTPSKRKSCASTRPSATSPTPCSAEPARATNSPARTCST